MINKKQTIIKRALISVFDKTGVLDFALNLTKGNIEILSSGGTAEILRKGGVNVLDVSDYTSFPEIMDGRVKTINPLIEGGILGLRDVHNQDATDNDIKWIDLVVCNFYPFSETVSKKDCDLMVALENIDIGGPTMIRSAAKNLGWVTVAVDPNDYSKIIGEINGNGGVSFNTRRKLSSKAFGHTAQYDAIIHDYLKGSGLPQKLSLTYNKHSEMRYGENPHQAAAAYVIPGNSETNVFNATMHQGKKLSYNNIMDADGALACIKEFEEVACVVVKHANPCGVAIGNDILDVYERAFNADSLSAFGGIIALNRTCTKEAAIAISKVFVEVILAPDFEKEALEVFKKKKNLRVLELGKFDKRKNKIEVRNVDGGILVQDTDIKTLTRKNLTVVTKKQPTEEDLDTALFTWKVLKHTKSNGILIAKGGTTIGLGAGQVSRVDAVHMALRKGGKAVKGGVLASDAFFPFRDSVDAIKDSEINTIIQPGGSIRDQDVIEACDEYGISMVFTQTRCFKH